MVFGVSRNFEDAYLVDIDDGSVNKERRIRKTMTNQFTDLSFSVSPEAAASYHEEGIVILHSGKGRLFSANGTGARIWRAVEQQLTLEAIAEEISNAYQIARTTAREHTVHFLGELERQALVQRGATL